jgi:hypothetical protein
VDTETCSVEDGALSHAGARGLSDPSTRKFSQDFNEGPQSSFKMRSCVVGPVSAAMGVRPPTDYWGGSLHDDTKTRRDSYDCSESSDAHYLGGSQDRGEQGCSCSERDMDSTSIGEVTVED